MSRLACPLLTALVTAMLTLVVGRAFVLWMHTGSGGPHTVHVLGESLYERDCEATVGLDGVDWIRLCRSPGTTIDVRWIEETDETCFDPCCGERLYTRRIRARLAWEAGADSLAVGIDAFDLGGAGVTCLPLWMCDVVVPRAFMEPQGFLRSILVRPRTFACRSMSAEHGYRQDRELHASGRASVLLELERPGFAGRVIGWSPGERRVLVAYVHRADGDEMTMDDLRQVAASIRWIDGGIG